MEQNIVLIGPMGSGKTGVGKKLSLLLGRNFFDSDAEIIAKAGISIDYIFDIEGEVGFRRRESKVLADLMTNNGSVIATGGGVITQKINRQTLAKAFVVYLKTDIATLVTRCAQSKSRPLLNKSTNLKQTITNILSQRQHLYTSCADFIVDTSNKKLNAIATEIKQQLSH